MKANEITKEKVIEYLRFRGVREVMIFGDESEKVDPIDRHVFLRDMYERFTGYRMTSEGMRLPMSGKESLPVFVDMWDFDGIQSIDDAVINLKFLTYAKEPYQQIANRRLDLLKKVDKEEELER